MYRKKLNPSFPRILASVLASKTSSVAIDRNPQKACMYGFSK
jgi:hypothetical protein